MDSRTICRQHEYVDISGDIADLMNGRRWNSLILPKGYGKTTLLSMLYYFFDIDEESFDLFKNSEISKTWHKWKDYLNKRVVISLDFNDFSARNMISALTYIRDKMIDLYKEKLHLIISDKAPKTEWYMRCLTSLENYDPSTDPPASIRENQTENIYRRRVVSDGRNNLEDSLDRLLQFFYHGEYSKENAVLLIDNMYLLEKISMQNGYYRDMYDFLYRYLSFEPDKSCCLYMQICDDTSDEDGYYGSYFCTDPSFLPHTTEMVWRPEHKAQRYQETQYDARIRNSKKQDESQMEKMLLEGRIIMLEMQNESLRNGEKYRIKTMERYRMPLKQDVPRYSDNMGLRRMKHFEKNEKYIHLNNTIKHIYEMSRSCKDYRELYQQMQRVKTDKQTDWDTKALEELYERCDNLRAGWKIRVHSSSSRYWCQMDIGSSEYHCTISKIKAYVTTNGSCVKKLFIAAAEKLIMDGRDGFTAMVSKVERDGTMFFFLSRNDFFLLEKFMQAHSSELKKGNPFIAHRSLLGISRDLMDIDSHNAQQAKLLWDYFQIVHGKDDIDIEEMYMMFILGWNAELTEDNYFRKDFSESTAQMFVLLMDSLDVLLGKDEISDASLLLNDDPKIWDMLGKARCWGDVGVSRI